MDFVEKLQTMMRQHDINPSLLRLELTKSMLTNNIELLILNMDTLKEFGIQFELDDFGTGYSSLQYLKRLPLNSLR